MVTVNEFPAECGMACLKCGACVQRCPQRAIQLLADGFQTKLKFDSARCIQCGLCEKVCPAKDHVKRAMPKRAYVATAKDSTIRKNSASGGAFASIAQEILAQGGVVFGASWAADWHVCHRRITAQEQLHILQGSKYARSEPLKTFAEAKKDLDSGKVVFYTGTPCQIAGLKSFLGKEYPNLLTGDVICHGTPNSNLISEYIDYLQKRQKRQIEQVRFRAHWKSKPGCFGTICYHDGRRQKTRAWLWQCDPYYYMYMMGLVYQEQCYSCQFACRERVSDITFGDPWGLEKTMNLRPGNISLILCNTEKGFDVVNACDALNKQQADIESAIAGNGQLNHPVKIPKDYETIVEAYKKDGIRALEQYYENVSGRLAIKAKLAFYAPEWLKMAMHKVRKRDT